MAIPSDPTVTSIVTDALRHAGLYNPTTGQVTELANNGFQTVKTEIWGACSNDDLLKTVVMIVLPVGSGQIAIPSDFNSEVTLDIYGCSTNMAFTATAGSASTITAASTFSGDISSMRGIYLFTTGGTGSGQYRQITNYDDSTKVFTITPNWSVNPASGTTAFVGHLKRRMVKDDPDGWSSTVMYPNQGFPRRYRMVGVSPLNTTTPALEIMPVPETANYALLLKYNPNLTRLDETGSLFVKHLRERRFLWVDGLIDQACRRYDEARYPAGYQAWNITLQHYASHNQLYDRVEIER